MASIYYIGDSTVAFNHIDTYPQQGMSNVLGLFVRDGIHICPHGHNGRSTKSFLDEGLFRAVEDGLDEGDFLFIQFGHNDEKDDPARHTDPEGAYAENLRYFIRFARERGAYPLLITPIARRLFDENGIFRPGSHSDYPVAMRKVGLEQDVPVADLTTLTENFLAQLGDEPSKPLFVWPKDNTHLKFPGAVEMVRLLAGELRRIGGVYGDILVQ